MGNKQQPTLIDNWIGWLQARIPVLKESHNVFWLKQAMGGYKSENEQYFHKDTEQAPNNTKQKIQEALNLLSKERVNTTGMESSINILKRLLEDSIPTPEAPDKILSAEEYLFEFSKKYKRGMARVHYEEFAESYAQLREGRAVEQAKEEWEKEKQEINDKYAEVIKSAYRQLNDGK